jgi:hypothetical protein
VTRPTPTESDLRAWIRDALARALSLPADAIDDERECDA